MAGEVTAIQGGMAGEGDAIRDGASRTGRVPISAFLRQMIGKACGLKAAAFVCATVLASSLPNYHLNQLNKVQNRRKKLQGTDTNKIQPKSSEVSLPLHHSVHMTKLLRLPMIPREIAEFREAYNHD